MTKKLCLVTSTRFQKKDFQRFGLDIINKKYEIAVIDLSKIINKRSNIVFKKYKYKICLVSPELHGKKINNQRFIKLIKKKKIKIDMICTKEKFFKNWKF